MKLNRRRQSATRQIETHGVETHYCVAVVVYQSDEPAEPSP